MHEHVCCSLFIVGAPLDDLVEFEQRWLSDPSIGRHARDSTWQSLVATEAVGLVGLSGDTAQANLISAQFQVCYFMCACYSAMCKSPRLKVDGSV